MTKKTILIFGVSSFVGSNLANFLKKDFKVIGTYHSNKINIDEVLTIPCDVLKKDQVRFVMLSFKPDVAIYCVGNSSVVYCAENEDVSDALNTGGLVNVIEHSQRYKTQVCLISSANVFSGEKESYNEMDIPDPSTLYGKQMASSEFYLQKNCLNYLIFRCCKLYGLSFAKGAQNIFEKINESIFLGESTSLDHRISFGWLDVSFLAILIKNTLIKSPTNRLFQISSQDTKSLFEFTNIMCEVNSSDSSIFLKGRNKFPMTKDIETKFDDGMEQKYSLDVSNIEGYLNIIMPTVNESLKLTKERLES